MKQQSTNAPAKDVFDSLLRLLESKTPIKIVATLDHQANAARVDLTLRPTKIVLFGNPQLGTPIMQNNPLAGLDLPQKILCYEDENGATYLVYNSVEYLVQRHGLPQLPQLEKVAGALNALVSNIVGGETVTVGNQDLADSGIVLKRSPHSVEDTYARIKTILENNPAIGIVAELDHQANAARVDLTLRPTKIIMFGNPRLGTPLMQQAQTIGIDLPQKFLVYEDTAGEVYVAYNDPHYLAQRHGITGADEVLNKIAGALDTISSKATEA